MIGTTISHYRILRKLGKGGMGQVYLAEDTALGRQVAIKFPNTAGERSRLRFLDEARAASKLQHTNIATIYDYGEVPGGPQYLVMELVKGEDISEVLRRGPLAPARAIAITTSLLSALEEAHRHRLVHRDIKPSNVMISERGAVKVLDFGLVKQIFGEGSPHDTQDETVRLGLTPPDVAVGTPMYMAPEQVRGKAVDARTDLYAAGLVLYECLTGKPAFSGPTQVDILAKVLYETPPAPSSIASEVSADLNRIVMKAIAKGQAERYQTAEEFSAALRSVHAAAPAGSVFTRTISLTTSLLLSKPVRSAAAVAGLAAVLALGGLFLLPWEHQPSPEAAHWYAEGLNAIRDGAYHRAGKALERAVFLDPQFAPAHARLAEAWSELEYSDKAKEEVLRAQLGLRWRGWLDTQDALHTQAIALTLTRDFKGAVERYVKIAAAAPESRKAAAEVDLGRAYEKSEETGKALESYERAAKRDPQYGAAFLRGAILYGRLQRAAEAAKHFREADALYAASSNLEGQTEVLFQRGFLASKERRIEEARADLERALAAARTTGNEYQQTAALLQLSTVAHFEGDKPLAVRLADEGIELARKAGIASLESRGLIDSGNAYFVRREFEPAESRYRQALELARRAGMRRAEARASFSLGSLHIQQRKPDEGLVEVEAARAFFERGGYRQETGQCLFLIAKVHQQKNEFDAALKDFEGLIRVAETAKDGPLTWLGLSGRAAVLASRESLPDAADAWSRAVDAARTLKDQAAVFAALTNYASVLSRLGRFAEAKRAIAEAETGAKRPGAPAAELWSIAHRRAELALNEGRYADAAEFSREALKVSEDLPLRVSTSNAFLAAAVAHLGHRAEARTMAVRALNAAPPGDSRLVAELRLTHAEVLLLAGDATEASKSAVPLLDSFSDLNRQESAFRAAAVAALAASRSGRRDEATNFKRRASSLIAGIQSAWPAKDVRTFLARPDIREFNSSLRSLP